jgi:transcriptional regulator with XRE-family HTH domain
MNARKKKKQAKIQAERRKKKNVGRDVSKALKDFTRVLTRKEIGKRFNLTTREVTYYTRYRGQRPLTYAQRRKILAFHKKLKEHRHGEEFQYSYRTKGKDRRIQSVIWIPTKEVNDLIKKLGEKEAAKRLGISKYTLDRWKSGKFKRLKPKHGQKLYKTFKKEFPKKFDGIFFLVSPEDQYFHHKGWIDSYFHYSIILFYQNNEGTKDDLLSYARQNYFRIKEWIIKPPKKFTEREALRAIDWLTDVVKGGSDEKITSGVAALSEFIDQEFKGKVRTRLQKKLQGKRLKKYKQ